MEAVHPGVRTRRIGKPRSRWWFVALAAAGAFMALAGVVTYLLGEPTRRYAENELNARLKGYKVRLPVLTLHPLILAFRLEGLTVRQEAHPEPPVVVFPVLTAGLHWRALLSGRVVGEIRMEEPRLHIDRSQFEQEKEDAVPLGDKGFQEAFDVFPLEINRVEVTNGSLTYVDLDPKHPLELTHLELLATNIRNVTKGEKNPSTVHVDADLFEKGRVRVDGQADFLAEPSPTYEAEFDVAKVPLEKLGLLAWEANLEVKGGIFAGKGRAENTPKMQTVHLEQLTVDDVEVNYRHTAPTEAAEEARLTAAKDATEKVARKQDLLVLVDHLEIRDSTFGYSDWMEKPAYRLFLSKSKLDVWDISTKAGAAPARIALQGQFMGAGPTQLDAALGEKNHNPTVNLSLEIEQTPMRTMNDLFRRYGNFDVVGGDFAFYTQLKVQDRHIDGYVKPLFTDVDVFDKRQDADKALFRQTYERIVGGIAGLLENRRDRVATETRVSGRADAPRYSLWQIIVNLVRNAFFRSILPGFESAVIGDEERG